MAILALSLLRAFRGLSFPIRKMGFNWSCEPRPGVPAGLLPLCQVLEKSHKQENGSLWRSVDSHCFLESLSASHLYSPELLIL